MIDSDGYRLNVGMVLINRLNQVFWGRRKGESAWQFPQGGINHNEDITSGMFRELYEELGLKSNHIEILAHTKDWLYYDVPYVSSRSKYRGQKQIWFLLKLIADDTEINLNAHHDQEFDAWQWVDYWLPPIEVVHFKRDVYIKALTELELFLHPVS